MEKQNIDGELFYKNRCSRMFGNVQHESGKCKMAVVQINRLWLIVAIAKPLNTFYFEVFV